MFTSSTTVLLALISFAGLVASVPIANRSPLVSQNVEPPSQGYLPSRRTESLGYHYGYKGGLPAPGSLNHFPSGPEYHQYPLSNDPNDLETSKPVYEIINDEYSNIPPINHRQQPVKIQPAVTTPVTPLKNQKYHQDSTAAYAVATAITTLDSLVENKGYNSPIHLPPSPVIALVLSHYGRYLPIARGPRVYSYMAVNNIHNHQPFGQYKWETDENG